MNPGCLCASEVVVKHVRDFSTQSQNICEISGSMLFSGVHKVLMKRLRLYAYKVPIVQALERVDRPSRINYATKMLKNIMDDAEFLNRIMFSDEACFYLSGIIKYHNVCIWRSENPHECRKLQRYSPKGMVWTYPRPCHCPLPFFN